MTMWLRVVAALALRWAKIQREQARAAEEGRGRRVVAELPSGEAVDLFLQDAVAFYWGDHRVGRAAPLPEAVPALEDLEDGDHGRGPGRALREGGDRFRLRNLPEKADFLFLVPTCWRRSYMQQTLDS